jgi:hypothetical protein
MYSRGDVSSTYDFRLITNAIKNFINERPGTKRRDLIDGVDFKPMDKKLTDEDILVDFNVDSIEENIKEYLKKKQGDKSDEDDDEDEDDSFYAVGDDLNDVEDSEDYETNKLSDSLKNYMSSMDEELREQKNLSRLDTNTSSTKQSSKQNPVDDLDIDLNLVTNALESYSSQLGLSGPVSNILKSLGI